MIPLVAVSGAECVDALSSAGFSLKLRSSDGSATMAKGLQIVIVPDVPMLSPNELVSVLRDAGVGYSDFLDLLSEAPTDPAIMRERLVGARASR